MSATPAVSPFGFQSRPARCRTHGPSAEERVPLAGRQTELCSGGFPLCPHCSYKFGCVSFHPASPSCFRRDARDGHVTKMNTGEMIHLKGLLRGFYFDVLEVYAAFTRE